MHVVLPLGVMDSMQRGRNPHMFLYYVLQRSIELLTNIMKMCPDWY